MFNAHTKTNPQQKQLDHSKIWGAIVIVQALTLCASMLTPTHASAQEELRRFKLLKAEELSAEQAKLAQSIRSGPRSSTGSTATQENAPLGSPFNVWLRSPEIGDSIQKKELHLTNFVSDKTYKHALGLFGEKGVADLIAVNGYYDLVSMTLNVDRTPVPTH